MDILYKTPKLKKNIYISEPEEAIVVNITDIKIKKIIKLSNGKGYKIYIYIGNSHCDKEVKYINNTDTNSLNQLLLNNNNWFNNNLTESEITELYINSFCNQTKTLEVKLLTIETNIMINNKICNNDTELSELFSNINKYKQYIISVEICNKGIHIYKNKSQNEWTIKSLYFTNINNDNNIDWSKNEIDTEWSIMLNETIHKLDENLIKLTKKIDDINNFKTINNQLLKEIKESNTPDKNWENKIDKIKNNIKNIIYLQ
jgi:hypothetical protein